MQRIIRDEDNQRRAMRMRVESAAKESGSEADIDEPALKLMIWR